MVDKTYCYPNTNILINKLGIKDYEQLMEVERKLTRLSIGRISQSPVKGELDLKHLQNIHKEIFSNLYTWAGKIRNVNISKGNSFCNVFMIEPFSNDIFNRLKKDNYLIGMKKDAAIAKLAEYIGDINALHPFREGNGRTQRQFISYLANATGLRLDYSKADPERMMKASIDSFKCEYKEFEEIFHEISEPMSLDEQKDFLKKISSNLYKVAKDLEKKGQLIDRIEEFKYDEIEEHKEIKNNDTMSLKNWQKEISDNKTEGMQQKGHEVQREER